MCCTCLKSLRIKICNRPKILQKSQKSPKMNQKEPYNSKLWTRKSSFRPQLCRISTSISTKANSKSLKTLKFSINFANLQNFYCKTHKITIFSDWPVFDPQNVKRQIFGVSLNHALVTATKTSQLRTLLLVRFDIKTEN